MKSFLIILLLVWASSVQAASVGYQTRPDCGTLASPATAEIFCLQKNTVSGRTTNRLYGYDGTTWFDFINWSNLTAPAGNQALAMAASTTTWTWGAATSTGNLFALTDGTNNTGTGYLAKFSTSLGSGVKPFRFDSNGNGLEMSTSGVLSKIGTGAIDAGSLAGTITNANGGTGQNSSAWSGIMTVNAGTWTINSILTSGRIPFAGAGNTINSDANLAWDNTTKRIATFGEDIGGDSAWVETLVPNSVSLGSLNSIGNTTKPFGGVFASRASNSGAGANQATLISIANQDLAGSANTVYGFYTEVWRQSTAHANSLAQGIEIAVINKGSTATTDPYTISPAGLTEALRLGVGKPGVGGLKASTGLSFVNVEASATAKFNQGILFGSDSIDIVAGLGKAVALAQQQGIIWYVSAGVPGPHIRSDVSTSGQGMRFVFGNNTVNFQNSSGTNQFVVDSSGNITVAGTITTVNATATISATKTIRAAGGAADCTLIFTGGILTGGSC